MNSTLDIPSVTLADLEAFRARHFHDVPAADKNTQLDAQEPTYDDDADDDGLGYYPDGVKRTLTDEQIAMFRHSEIYALLRERQVKQENKDAGFIDEPVHLDSDAEAVDPAKEALVENARASDDEEEYAAFLAAEQKQIQDEASQNKRKRSPVPFDDDHDRARSTRRKTREMDQVGVDDTVLDYGEETQADTHGPVQGLNQEELDELNGRKRVKYDDAGDIAASAVKPAVEGRKIWWPTIGDS